MPTPSEAVTLLIGGRAHSQWESYRIDSDLLTPADAWDVSVWIPRDQSLPEIVGAGSLVQVQVGTDTVLTGLVDDLNVEVGKQGTQISLSGRDQAAVLVDCSAPLMTLQEASLEQIVAQVVRPLGIRAIRYQGAAHAARRKVQVEPGMTAWELLANACEANGVWPWMAPDGTLIIGGPDYSAPPVADLVLRYNGRGNNVERLAVRLSIANRYSEITVLGQAPGSEIDPAQTKIRATARDRGLRVHRPQIVVDSNCETLAIAQRRARKLLADSRLDSLSITVTVPGHRTSGGKLWTPGQRVHLVSEPHGLNGIYFLMRRSLQRDRYQGTTTELELKEDGAWVLDAQPQKVKRKAGRKKSADEELAIL